MRIATSLQGMAVAGLLSCSPAVEPPERTILEAALTALEGERHGGRPAAPHTHLLLDVRRPDPWSGCGAPPADEPADGFTRGSDGGVVTPRESAEARRLLEIQAAQAPLRSEARESRQAECEEYGRRLQEAMPDLQTATFQSYASRNRAPDPAAPALEGLKLGVEHVEILPYRRYEKLAASGAFWGSVEREYGGPVDLWVLSQIGVHPSRTQALLFIAFQSGMHVGEGRFVLLSRDSGTWHVVRSVQAYVI